MNIIPDSSFFICFLDDLEGHLPFNDRLGFFSLIIKHFTTMVVPGVDQESHLQRIPSHILNQFRMMETPVPETQSGLPIELLRPLLGR